MAYREIVYTIRLWKWALDILRVYGDGRRWYSARFVRVDAEERGRADRDEEKGR